MADGSADFSKAFDALNAQGQDIVRSEQAELSPLISRAQSSMAEPRPSPPKLERVPEPPQSNPHEDREAWLSAATTLAGLGGLFVRRNVNASLLGFAGAVKGFTEGNIAAYREESRRWKEAADQVVENNQQMVDEYNAILNDRKLNIDEQMNQIQLVAAKYKDMITYQAAAVKNFAMVEQIVMKMDQFGQKFDLETQRLHDQNEQANARLTNMQERLDLLRDQLAGKPVSPDLQRARGAAVASGMPMAQAVPGWGRRATDERAAAQQAAISQIMAETGMSPEEAGKELANRQIDYVAGRRSVTQLNTMLGATRQAVEQLDFNIGKTKEEMKKLGSANLSPIINAIARGEERWTGEPAYSSLFYFMHATAVESARILAGGQASVAQLHEGAMEEAQKWANINMTPASFDAVAKAMRDEGQNRIQTYQAAIEKQRIGGGNGKPGTASPVLKYDAEGNPLQ